MENLFYNGENIVIFRLNPDLQKVRDTAVEIVAEFYDQGGVDPLK